MLVPLYKGKGDVRGCGAGMGVKLLEPWNESSGEAV